MCEEVQKPEREVPRAMVLSVAAAGITGVIYLIPILFVLPNVEDLLGVANGQPIGADQQLKFCGIINLRMLKDCYSKL